MRRRFPSKSKPAAVVDPAVHEALRQCVARLPLDEMHDAKAHGLARSYGVAVTVVQGVFLRERADRGRA